MGCEEREKKKERYFTLHLNFDISNIALTQYVLLIYYSLRIFLQYLC